VASPSGQWAIEALSTPPVTYFAVWPTCRSVSQRSVGWLARFVDAARGRGRDVRAWLWWTVRLVLEGGQRCLEGAGGGQQAMWVADPQHPGDCLTGHYCPAYAGSRAADGDPVQRREALDSKETQAAQIKDQPAATHQMPPRVLGQNVCVGCVDVAVGADDGYRRPQSTTG
jgi:hypothetical protein